MVPGETAEFDVHGHAYRIQCVDGKQWTITGAARWTLYAEFHWFVLNPPRGTKPFPTPGCTDWRALLAANLLSGCRHTTRLPDPGRGRNLGRVDAG